MKLPQVISLALWLSVSPALAQQATVCTNELATSDDCADVINPIACYNQFGFNGARTLTCIDGKDDADKKRKACKCCTCIGTKMCNWVSQQRYCQ